MKQKLLLIMVSVMILLFTACKSSTTKNTGDTEQNVDTTEVLEEESTE